MSDDPRHRSADRGAARGRALTRQGFRIIERNYRTRWGELDIVAFDGRTLGVLRGQARRLGGSRGGPLDAVGPGKQARVRKMAGSWLIERRPRPRAELVRFDAIGVTSTARVS